MRDDERLSNLSDVRALLHCYYTPVPDPDDAAFGDAWMRSMARLRQLDLVTSRTAPETGYEVTERGRVYCEAIRSLPLPIHVWAMPPEREKK